MKCLVLHHKKRKSDGVVTDESFTMVVANDPDTIFERISQSKSKLVLDDENEYWVVHQIVVLK